MFQTGDVESLLSDPSGRKVYGPVPSRRLGRSLGIDLVPFKTCTYDCIYCQLGRTTSKTIERTSFSDVDALVDEVRTAADRSRPDYITLAGSGEPTLEVRFGDSIEGIKKVTDVPVALITNGSLLWDDEVRRAAALADVVLPNLDAADERFFQWVNRPASGLSLDRVLEGLVRFRERYDGAIWLEVMILAGKTDAEKQISGIAKAAARIRPDCIHLNTPVRPGGSGEARPTQRDRLEKLSRRFVPRADVVCDFQRDGEHPSPVEDENADAVLALLRRRPCTLNEIVVGLDTRCKTVRSVLKTLEAGRMVRCFRKEGRLYYAAIVKEEQRC